jgi:hypothetical protein
MLAGTQPSGSRFDLLTLELDEKGGNCVHDRLVVVGGSEPSGSLCGDRSGEVGLDIVTTYDRLYPDRMGLNSCL